MTRDDGRNRIQSADALDSGESNLRKFLIESALSNQALYIRTATTNYTHTNFNRSVCEEVFVKVFR